MARKPLLIKLDEPIVNGKKEIKEVTMRPPMGLDLMGNIQGANAVQRDLSLISNLCDLNMTLEDWKTVDGVVVMQLQGALKGFLLSQEQKLLLLQQK